MRALLSATLAAVLFSCAPVLACDDHVGKCELDAVKPNRLGGLLNFHGSATCDRGRVFIRVYDGDTFLGVVSDGFRGHAIRTTHVDVPKGLKLKNVRIKYSIEPR